MVTPVIKSLIFRFLAIGFSFLFVSLLIKHIGSESYGLWVLFSTAIGWTGLINFGIPNTLRNEFSGFVYSEKINEANSLISNSFFLLGLIATGFTLLLLLFVMFFDFASYFNIASISSKTVDLLAFFVITTFGLNIYFSSVNSLFFGLNRPEYVFLSGMLVPLLMCLSVIILRFFEIFDLKVTFFVLCICQLIPNILGYLFFFAKYNYNFPKFKRINFSSIKKLLPSSSEFFIIQVAFVILFTSDKIIIASLFGPEMLASYDISLRLYSPFLIVSSVFASVLWGKISFYWYEKNADLYKVFFYLIGISFISIVLVCIFTFFSDEILTLWLGDQIELSSSLIVSFAVFTVLKIWIESFACFLNGINSLAIQRNLALVQAIINIPLSIYLGNLFGPHGVVWATSFSLGISAVILPFASLLKVRERYRSL